MVSREVHRARPWRVNDIAGDFTLWDVWELPIAASNSGRENFRSFHDVAMGAFAAMPGERSLTGLLFALRDRIARVVPLDRHVNTLPIPGCRETSVGDRLGPGDRERSRATGSVTPGGRSPGLFRPVYLFEDESLHELSNDTVHALMHLGWVRRDDGSHTATLAVYVIPRGLLGRAYLAMIWPFRHLVVYPAMMRAIAGRWRDHCRERRGPVGEHNE
ncbi:MAG: DUF2867 domain-containing protein [Spirochaetes bacterium]|nr:DUF2867 domain-containing protein [Spirochaetota bacterium]